MALVKDMLLYMNSTTEDYTEWFIFFNEASVKQSALVTHVHVRAESKSIDLRLPAALFQSPKFDVEFSGCIENTSWCRMWKMVRKMARKIVELERVPPGRRTVVI